MRCKKAGWLAKKICCAQKKKKENRINLYMQADKPI